MLRVANRTRGQDQIVGCKKGESGGQGSGRTVNAVKFSKPKGNLVIGNCPAWTVVTGLSLIQWGFSNSPYRLSPKRSFSSKEMIQHFIDDSAELWSDSQLTQVLGGGLRQDIYWGSWGHLTQWWAHMGCGSPPDLSSDDHSLLKAPGKLFPTSISFPGCKICVATCNFKKHQEWWGRD